MELELSRFFSSLSKPLCEFFGKWEPRFDRVIAAGNPPSNRSRFRCRANYFVAAMVFMDLCGNQYRPGLGMGSQGPQKQKRRPEGRRFCI